MTENDENKGNNESGFKKLFLMLTIGFITIFVGVAILAVATVLSGGSADVGGVIFIWFIPIVFGAGPHAAWMILFALILAVLSIVVLLILYRKR
ncbi:MAG: TIGR00304 family membrane protein [Candidatus Bathyarchaeales archaeon]